MTEMERYVFDTWGYLVIPDALTPQETQDCLEASRRLYATLPQDAFRQLGNTFEQEPAFENLVDHPSTLPKARALFGDRFILQSSWLTMAPAGFRSGGGFHQDGSGAYEFRRLGTPTPLVQLRTGFVLTDMSSEGMGNLALIPGSHNVSSTPPPGGVAGVPITHVVCAKPGSAIMFHQGVFHTATNNDMNHNRFIIHMVYSPPWLIRSDRMHNSPQFLERLTPMRRALMGEFTDAGKPFSSMKRLPFEDWGR